MPTMMVFTGTGNWEPFIFQFERIAERCNWRPSKKTEKLLDCLADQALEYAQRRSLITELDLRCPEGRAESEVHEQGHSRKQLHSVKQGEDETLESYSQRVHFLTMDGHPEANEPTIQQIATFLGVRTSEQRKK